MPTPDMRVLADPTRLANWRTDTHPPPADARGRPPEQANPTRRTTRP